MTTTETLNNYHDAMKTIGEAAPYQFRAEDEIGTCIRIGAALLEAAEAIDVDIRSLGHAPKYTVKDAADLFAEYLDAHLSANHCTMVRAYIAYEVEQTERKTEPEGV